MGPAFIRSRLVHIACAAAVVMTGSLTSGPSAGAATAPAPWASTNFNAAASRANLGESTLTEANIASVTPAWSLSHPDDPPAPCGQDAQNPVISGSRVYLVNDGALFAKDLATGKSIWERDDPLLSRAYVDYLSVSNGLIVLERVDCQIGHDRVLVSAYTVRDGATVWTRKIDSRSVEVTGSTVITKSADKGTVTAWRVADGSQIWQKHAPDEKCNDEFPRVVAGLVLSYVCDPDTHAAVGVRARTVSTGTVRWQKPGDLSVVGGASDTDPNTNIYLSNERNGPRVIAVDPQTGGTRFALVTSKASFIDTPAITSTRVYSPCYRTYATRRDVDTACAFDAQTGALIWKRTYPDTVLDDLVYANGMVVGFGGSVLDATDGHLVATLPFQGGSDDTIVGNGHIGTQLIHPGGIDFTVFGLPTN